MSRRVVITGLGLISPFGNTPEKLWHGLSTGQSAVRAAASLTPAHKLPFAAEAWEFTGAIEEFGPLEKILARTIKKNLKIMCREIQMGVAVAQLCMTHAGLSLDKVNRERIGVLYGSDYLLTLPQEFAAGVRKCLGPDGQFDFKLWADNGLTTVEPLWLLKYLPNLPAAHVAIFNDLRGPNNSVTVREASANVALAEAYLTIHRGHADQMLAGATGTRVHTARTMHVVMQETMAQGDDPAALSKPFDLARNGQVVGEGAAAVLLEELETAQARGATILGEVVGYGSSVAQKPAGTADLRTSVGNAVRAALRSAGISPADLGHLHAHGLATPASDAAEAQGIADALGSAVAKVPVAAAKANFGNLGAAGGAVELIGSLLALQAGTLFPLLNYRNPDPACPIRPARTGDAAGDSFINLNLTPQGHAAAVTVRRFAA